MDPTAAGPRPIDAKLRRRRLSRVRRAVAAGEYENALKLSVALDRMLERIRREP